MAMKWILTLGFESGENCLNHPDAHPLPLGTPHQVNVDVGRVVLHTLWDEELGVVQLPKQILCVQSGEEERGGRREGGERERRGVV